MSYYINRLHVNTVNKVIKLHYTYEKSVFILMYIQSKKFQLKSQLQHSSQIKNSLGQFLKQEEISGITESMSNYFTTEEPIKHHIQKPQATLQKYMKKKKKRNTYLFYYQCKEEIYTQKINNFVNIYISFFTIF